MLAELDQIVVMADPLGFGSYPPVERHFHTKGVEVMPSPMPEVWRTLTSDSDNKPFRSEGRPDQVVQRLMEHDWLICGSPEDVSRKISERRTCGGDSNLEYMSWNFYVQGNLSLDEQRRELELFGTKSFPELV